MFFRIGVSSGRRNEKDVFAVLIGIVFMFIICHTPRNIMNWYHFITVETIISCRGTEYEPAYWLHFLYKFGELTVILNSSLNFFVYCFVGPTFRKELFRILKIKQRPVNNRGQSTVTKSTRIAYSTRGTTLVLHQIKNRSEEYL